MKNEKSSKKETVYIDQSVVKTIIKAKKAVLKELAYR